MTQNPFGEGFDMNALLQQAQAMQSQLQTAQDELARTEVEGQVAGGLVTATVNGVGELTGVRISPEAASDGDLGEVGDLVVAAYRDAKAKADALASEKLGPLTGGMGGMGGEPGQPGAGGLGQLGF